MSLKSRARDALKTIQARLTMFFLSEPVIRLLATLMVVVAGFVCAASPAFAAIAFRAASFVDQNGSALTLTINRPAGTPGGALMVPGIVVRPSRAAITPPARSAVLRRP